MPIARMAERVAMPRAGASVLAIAALLAGCGMARLGEQAKPMPRGGASLGTPARTSSSPVLGPSGGSPALARTVAIRLLAALILPAGSHLAKHGPQETETIWYPNLVDVHNFFWLPMPMADAYEFLLVHVPAGTSRSGYGSSSTPTGGYEQSVSYSLNRLPIGLDSDNELLASIAAGPRGGTLVRADAQVSWYPPRSAAEYLRPSAYRAVTITASLVGGSAQSEPFTRTRTFTSPGVIARLAGLLNGLHAFDGEVPNCPNFDLSFTLTFADAQHRPAVVVSAAGCTGDLITVRGKPQPGLADLDSDRLLAIVRPLLGVPGRYY